ncbi:MAG TPA: ATP-binding protein, partial [Smithellaceae bacterium]|nr:ATP-binding protein [Smithellaceae bacterium]
IHDDGSVFFFLDSEPAGSAESSPPGQIYKEVSTEFTQVFHTGRPHVEGPIPDRWGNWVSALIPIPDARPGRKSAVLGMDINAIDWTKDIVIHCAPGVMATALMIALMTFFFILFRRSEKVRRQIADSEARLAESERAYRSVVTNMVDVFFRSNTDNEFVMLSPSAAPLLGYGSIDELIGKKTDIVWTNPQYLQDIFIELRIFGVVRDFEMMARRRDGTQLPMSVTIRTIYDDLGNPAGYEGIARDISDRKAAQSKQQELEKQISRAQKMEALGSLAGGVAHDLNNILSGIVSYPDLILMDLPKDSALRRPLETIKESGLKASAVVQDLLTLARRGVSASEIVQLNELVIGYLNSPEFLKMKSFHRRVSVQTELDDALMNIIGSPVHLSKTIMNLVSNAAEAMPQGGSIIINTRNRYVDYAIKGYDQVQEGDYAVLSVSDTGTGISPEDQARIFEPFFTKKKLGRSGTGLGLAVVWGTVKDHQGYIDVQSTEGTGTTFTLYLPATRKVDPQKPITDLEENLKSRGEKILVVDDVGQQREIASAILKYLGYDVATAASGEEAVQYLKGNRADLVILDMIMDPGIDGLETYKRIREQNPGQKAIITSGYSETDRVKKAQELGAGRYLKKPYTLENLGRAVKEEIEKK